MGVIRKFCKKIHQMR